MNVRREQLEALGWSADLIDEVLREARSLDLQLPELVGLPEVPEGEPHESDAGSTVNITFDAMESSSNVVLRD